MGINSFIAKANPDGTVRAVYCHWDGYIVGGVGETLHQHFQDPDRIDALLDGGDMSSLGSRIDAPEGHSFETPVNDCTIFYGRDRGEEDVSARNFTSMGEYMNYVDDSWTHYAYLYTDSQWFVCDIHDGSAILAPLAGMFRERGGRE